MRQCVAQVEALPRALPKCAPGLLCADTRATASLTIEGDCGPVGVVPQAAQHNGVLILVHLGGGKGGGGRLLTARAQHVS